MKRVLKSVLVFCAVSMLVGCASNQKIETKSEADVYEVEKSSEIKKRNENAEKEAQKRKTNSILADMFSSKYYEFGEGSVYTPKTFGGVKQELATFVVYPKTETAGFGSRYLASYYFITFDDQNRQVLTSAMNRYLKDFDGKKLNRKDNKSYKSYGTVKALIRWGTVKANNPYYSQNAVLTIGYRFENGSPYFTLQMEETPDDATFQSSNPNDIVFSMRLNYYLTKSQCKGFIDNLSNENIENILNEYNLKTFGVPEGEDVYFDDDAFSDEVEDVE